MFSITFEAYHTNNGFRVINGIVYTYECERCVTTRDAGHWTQSYVDKFFDGELSELNKKHKEAVYPYGHLHEVRKIAHEER